MEHLDLTYTAPLTYEEDGTIRIQGSRVTLDSILHAFQQGATAEQIQDSSPSVTLRDVYRMISYCLEKREQVDVYLNEQTQSAQELRRFLESRPAVISFREKIRTRRMRKAKS